MKYLKLLLAIWLCSVFVFSCRPNYEEASWEINALAPIASSSLSIQNILSDSIVNIAGDSSISMVFRNTIYNYGLDSMIKFRDTTMAYSASVENLELGDQTIVYPISLGQIASNPDLGVLGNAIILNNGGIGIIPPLGDPTPLSTGEITIDASSYFESIEIDSGYMDLHILNELPMDITNIVFQLKNQGSVNFIAQDTFPLIASGSSVSATYELHGQTIQGNIVAQIVEMSSPGSGGFITIDTSDALIPTISIRDITPLSATAIFPEQNIVDKWDYSPMKGLGEIKLSSMRVKTGLLEVTAISTIEDSMFFNLQMPGALKDGMHLNMDNTIPPATPSDASISVFQVPFDDYVLDLRGFAPIERDAGMDINGNEIIDTDTVNTYCQYLTGRIDSTGQIVSLALSDSLRFEVKILNLIGDYGIGYLGKDTVQFGPEIIDFDLLSNITGGSIDLNDVSVNLEVNNQIGADANMRLSQLKSINSSTGSEVDLVSADLNNGFLVNPAQLTGGTPPFTTETSSLTLDASNSNIEEFIENLPNQLSYNVEIEQNSLIASDPSIADIVATPPNFIYFDGVLSASMNVEIPLHFASNQLTLVDTTEFSINQENQTAIQSGTFTLLIDNGFPIEAVSSLTLLDELGSPLLDLISDETIASGVLGSNGKVIQSTSSEIHFSFTSADLSQIFEASQLLIQVQLDHPTAKIYDYYSIDVQLTADFNYIINQ